MAAAPSDSVSLEPFPEQIPHMLTVLLQDDINRLLKQQCGNAARYQRVTNHHKLRPSTEPTLKP